MLQAELDSLGKSPPLLECEEISLAMEMERAPSMPFVRSSTLRRFRRGAPLGSSFVALAIDIEFDDESESEPIVEFEATELRRPAVLMVSCTGEVTLDMELACESM